MQWREKTVNMDTRKQSNTMYIVMARVDMIDLYEAK